MAREIYEFEVLIPAGTPSTAPLVADLTMPDRVVTRIEILVPPGPRGNVGFAIGAADTPVIPTNPGAWVITDNERIGWEVEQQIISGAWQLIGYNSGGFDHTLYVRFLTELIPAAGTDLAGLIDPAQLSGAPPPPVAV